MRKLLPVAVMGAAIGVPYVASQWTDLKANVFGSGRNSAAGNYKPNDAYSSVPQLPAMTNGVPMGAGMNPQADETPIVDISEAFRWDVTPQTVMARWPRVSSGLPGEDLHGMRVTLISGLRVDDVAGSLTYYFSPAQKCARITFAGSTGDPTRLIQLLTSRYDFKQVGSEPGSVRYEIRWNGDAHSWFTVKPAAIVRSSSPYTRYEVQVNISDPAVK